jgi:hypothetical protein
LQQTQINTLIKILTEKNIFSKEDVENILKENKKEIINILDEIFPEEISEILKSE